MPIETICSSCETRFTVQDDLLGRPMRCPDCREVFVVRAAASIQSAALTSGDQPSAAGKPPEIRTEIPAPKYQTGSITDFLHVLSTEESLEPDGQTGSSSHAEPIAFPELVEQDAFHDFEVIEEPPATKPIPPEKKARPKPAASPVPAPGTVPSPSPATKKAAVVLEVVEPPPTEVKWSADLAPPPPRRGAISTKAPPKGETEIEDAPSEPADETPEEESYNEPPRRRRRVREEEDKPPPRRRKKKSRFVLILLLLAFIVGGVGIGGFLIMRHMERAPERLYEQAKKDYDAKNYEPARKQFEELVRDSPKHRRAGEARFLMELCSLRLAVGSVTVRSDPAPAQAQLDKFLKATEPPEMQPFLEAGKFGGDVGQATLKLNEDVLDKGDDVFNQDSPDDSENWLRHAEKIGAVVDRYRGMDVEREKVGKKMTVLRKRIDGARTRIRLLADARTRLAGADDKVIDDVRTAAQSQTFFAVNAAKEGKDVALVDDPAFKQLLAEAEGTIQGRVAYKRFEPPIATTAARGGSGTGLLFAPRVDVPDPNRVPAPQGPSSVFFALARGVLYALEDIEGRVLWATRVGIDGDSLPVQLPGNALHPDLVLVVSNDGIHAALTARIARTGEAVWHQALPSPVIGRPVIVGQRVFVPLSEVLAPDAENAHRLEQGVVWEIEIANGAVVGRIVLGRPLGGSAARRPGTGQLFFPAEAKGVYVFDVEKIGADGSRIDPAYLGIIPTDHTAGTLRGEPVITAGEGETPSYLVLSVTDGLESMKLRAYPLSPADQPPAIQGVIPPPILLAGWSWFPPYCDTEKLAVVSDRGEFGLFGIKQAGNLDIPLFVLPPSPYLLPDIRMPARGQIVHADEHDFWFLARGLLYHLKLGFDAERGLRLVQRGEPISIGEPLQPAQVNARGDFAMVVTQASASASCRATAIDLRIGKVRWQRQLGLIAQGDPIRLGDAVMLMDHDGGLYKIDAGPLARSTDESWLIEEKWLVARPLNDLVEASHFLSGGDGSSVYAVLATRAPQGARIVVRRYVAGQPIEERSAALPAPFAGNPIVLGKHVIIPLANGMLYRMNLTTDRPLDDGPTWRAERISTQAICHLAAINEGEFLATDGARSLNRWRWTVEQDYNRRGGLNLAERIAAPPVVYTDGNDQRVFVFDIRNNATLWDADRLTAMNPTTLRAWRAGAMGTLPSGTLTNGPFFERDAKGKPRIVFVVDKVTVVWLDPNLPAPQWIAKPNEVGPGDNVVARPAVFGDRLYLTHRAGKCVSLDLERGESRDELTKLRGSTVPSGSVIALEGLLLVPLSDGTLLLQSNGPKRLPKLPMIWLPLPPLGAMVPLPLQP